MVVPIILFCAIIYISKLSEKAEKKEATMIKLKRVYLDAEKEDGYRILRGIGSATRNFKKKSAVRSVVERNCTLSNEARKLLTMYQVNDLLPFAKEKYQQELFRRKKKQSYF